MGNEVSGEAWSDDVGRALYGDVWDEVDYSDGISDLVPLIDKVGRAGWSPCAGGDERGHQFAGRNMCAGCGSLFAAIPDGYVPRHDSPSADALIASVEHEGRS